MIIDSELLFRLGLDPQGLALDMSSSPTSRIKRILGSCPYCQLLRIAFLDSHTGELISIKCPLPTENVAFLCTWGGRRNLPIGED